MDRRRRTVSLWRAWWSPATAIMKWCWPATTTPMAAWTGTLPRTVAAWSPPISAPVGAATCAVVVSGSRRHLRCRHLQWAVCPPAFRLLRQLRHQLRRNVEWNRAHRFRRHQRNALRHDPESGSKIFVAGTSTQSGTGRGFCLGRAYSTSGTLYTSFGTAAAKLRPTSAATMTWPARLTIQSNGEIVLAGYSDDAAAATTAWRLRPLHYHWQPRYGLRHRRTGHQQLWRQSRPRRWRGHRRCRGRIIVSGSSFIDGSGNIDTQSHLPLLRYNCQRLARHQLQQRRGGRNGVTTDFSDLGFSTESASGVMVDTNGPARSWLAPPPRAATAASPSRATTPAWQP